MSKNNSLAFPYPVDPSEPYMTDLVGTRYLPFPGLTKREYFAAMALQGILSGITVCRSAELRMDNNPASAPRLAVRIAD